MSKDLKALKTSGESMEVKKSPKVNISLVFDRMFGGVEYPAGSIVMKGECAAGLSEKDINKALQLNQLKAYPVDEEI